MKDRQHSQILNQAIGLYRQKKHRECLPLFNKILQENDVFLFEDSKQNNQQSSTAILEEKRNEKSPTTLLQEKETIKSAFKRIGNGSFQVNDLKPMGNDSFQAKHFKQNPFILHPINTSSKYSEKENLASSPIHHNNCAFDGRVDNGCFPNIHVIKAKFYVACMMFYGSGIDHDTIKAQNIFNNVFDEMQLVTQMLIFLTEEEKGDIFFYLARAYDEGWGQKQDKQRAMSLYCESCKYEGEQRNSIAYFNLALMHFLGEGVCKSHIAARQYYEKAASLGHISARFNLAAMLKEGLGGEINYEKAASLYEANIELGDSKSMNCLGLLYKSGNVSTGDRNQDMKLSISLFQRAIEADDCYAMFNLATILEENHDFVHAYRLYMLAKKRNHGAAGEAANSVLRVLESRLYDGNL